MTSTTPRRRRRRTRSQWSRLMNEQASSGLSQQAFCTQHNLGLSTFCKWRRVLERVDVSPVGFVEIPLAGVDSKPGFELELELGEGMRFRFRRR